MPNNWTPRLVLSVRVTSAIMTSITTWGAGVSSVVRRLRSWANSVAVPVKTMRLPLGSINTWPFKNWPLPPPMPPFC
ncbi:hypothetical protein D3C87_1488270 [compost metagenome]